ncbi:Uncharacterised protein [Klebsiella quasipneumoniae]|nr:hypothetical protein WP3S18C02_40570 [Klebsiella quasipneumoniae]SLQ66976.1 Uncharacterised protein [Klebsiella quasipneumoniae]
MIGLVYFESAGKICRRIVLRSTRYNCVAKHFRTTLTHFPHFLQRTTFLNFTQYVKQLQRFYLSHFPCSNIRESVVFKTLL